MNLSLRITVLVLVFSICSFRVDAQTKESAEDILAKCADVLFKSDTVYYERDFQTPETKGKVLQCKERYYLQNKPDGTYDARSHQTIFTGVAQVTNYTTIYVKNDEGLWDIYPTLAINISAFVKNPPSVFPFRHLRTVSPARYKMELSETNENGKEFYVITAKSLHEEEDRKVSITDDFIPIDLRYVINKQSYLPYEFHEVEQNGMKIDKKFDKIQLNEKFEDGLFSTLDRRKVTPTTTREVGELKL